MGLAKGMRRWIRRRRRRAPKPVFLAGPPPGMESDELASICKREFGTHPRTIEYQRLSGWKPTGTFRVRLTLSGRRRVCVIFKNALYLDEDIPALVGLPLAPGPPEWGVYQAKDDGLVGYLPRVYWMNEVTPGRHYRYLLEDLGEKYRRLDRRSETVVRLAANLSCLHQTFMSSGISRQSELLLRYDEAFRRGLLEYAFRNIQTYALRSTDSLVHEVVERWSEIADLVGRSGPGGRLPPTLVHGDLNFANIMVSRRDDRDIKLIDWEWAGFAEPHADLASLLKRADPVLEAQAVRAYAGTDSRLGLDEHIGLYSWWQLQRGLLDAGFMAAQLGQDDYEGHLDRVGFVERSLQRVLGSHAVLSSA